MSNNSSEKLNSEMDRDLTSVLPGPVHRSWRFWGAFVGLCLLSFISALDVSIVTTALPTITKDIGGENDYVWIANSFVFASSVPQPLFGQLSNIFGRRDPMILAVLLFAVGSGIAGGAMNPAMLIGGRTVQGLGAGGIYVLLDIICCDLVPLRERGKYLGYMFSFAGLGATLGPVIGGALALANWRWIFFLNLPVCGLALVSILLLLKVNFTRSPTWRHALARVDFFGNALFVLSMIAVLFGLVMGGVKFPWSSYHIVIPLVLGVLGWAAFHIHQASGLCPEPTLPPRLFTNRTSAVGFVLTFIAAILVQSIAYFVPVYFQAVIGTSSLRSGIDFLPFAVTINFFAVVSGIALTKTGLYRPLHWIGFGLSIIGMGLLSTLNERSSTAEWACYQIVASAGSGSVLSTLLPAIMAALPEADVAASSAAYAFVRTFGYVWGVTLPSIVFNGQFDKHAAAITDGSVRSQLRSGAAYSYASQQFIQDLPAATRAEVTGVYVRALRPVWLMGLAFSCLAFFSVFLAKDIPLRKDLSTEYGLKEEQATDAESGEDSEKSSMQGSE
jgi:hypothetical protein